MQDIKHNAVDMCDTELFIIPKSGMLKNWQMEGRADELRDETKKRETENGIGERDKDARLSFYPCEYRRKDIETPTDREKDGDSDWLYEEGKASLPHQVLPIEGRGGADWETNWQKKTDKGTRVSTYHDRGRAGWAKPPPGETPAPVGPSSCRLSYLLEWKKVVVKDAVEFFRVKQWG